MTTRNVEESFSDYQERRKKEREALDAHLLGTVVVEGKLQNRTALRKMFYSRKGQGSVDPLLYKRAKLRRLKKLISN